MKQCAGTLDDLNDAILLLNTTWRYYDDAVLLSLDIVVGFRADKSDWLRTLDAASAQMTHAPFLLNTIPKHFVWIVDQIYVRCKTSKLRTATAGDQASLQALQQKPQPAPQLLRHATQLLQYKGPPKDMLRGPRGHAPITLALASRGLKDFEVLKVGQFALVSRRGEGDAKYEVLPGYRLVQGVDASGGVGGTFQPGGTAYTGGCEDCRSGVCAKGTHAPAGVRWSATAGEWQVRVRQLRYWPLRDDPQGPSTGVYAPESHWLRWLTLPDIFHVVEPREPMLGDLDIERADDLVHSGGLTCARHA